VEIEEIDAVKRRIPKVRDGERDGSPAMPYVTAREQVDGEGA
jgi:hypothetical protein